MDIWFWGPTVPAEAKAEEGGVIVRSLLSGRQGFLPRAQKFKPFSINISYQLCYISLHVKEGLL